MFKIPGFRGHVRAHLSLGLPLIGSQLAQVGVQTTDVLMLGWYDVDALAALVLASSLFLLLFLFISGFAWAVTPLVAAATQVDDDQRIRRVTRMGLWLVVLASLASLPIVFFSAPILRLLGQDPGLAADAQVYLRIAGFGLIPAMVFMVFRSYLSALERTRVQFRITLGAALANVGVNWVLIFGNLGFPELGIRGAAIASVSVNTLSALWIAAYALRSFPQHDLFRRIWRPDFPALAKVARMGWQIGLATLAEVGLFNFSSIVMGWLGTLALAAHGIALQLASIAFMVQIGLANAATVRAGRAFGRDDRTALRNGAISVFTLGLGFAVVSLALFIAFPKPLVGLFLAPDDPLRAQILTTGAVLLGMAALFQFFDSAQVIGISLLRGMQDTQVPLYIVAGSYWLVGAPLSYLLGISAGWGGIGVWSGLVIGLAVAAIGVTVRFRAMLKRMNTPGPAP